MTVCIAAIGTENGEEYVVTASDKMLTNSLIGGSFEHPTQKYKIINEKFIAMLAGNPILFSELVTEDMPKNATLREVADNIKERMKEKRLTRINEEILGQFSIDREVVGRVLEGEVTNRYMDTILESIAKFRLDTVIILAGVEKKKGKVLLISETGVHDFTEIGFNTIGTGDVEATNTLLFQQQHRGAPLRETIYNVYKAKKNSEVADGVGRLTDLLVASQKEIREIDNGKIKTLFKVYERELKYGKNNKLLNKVIDGEL